MAKKKVEQLVEDIRKVVSAGTAVFGLRENLKLLKAGQLQHIYLASNCKKENKADVEHYANLVGTTVTETNYHNEELGILCKRHHSISMVGVKK